MRSSASTVSDEQRRDQAMRFAIQLAQMMGLDDGDDSDEGGDRDSD